MNLVVDASIAIHWYIDGPDTVAALEVLNGGDTLIAPDLLIPEICNTAWKLQRVGRITREHGRRIIGILASPFAQFFKNEDVADRAYLIATELDHPVYDCYYLALAEREKCLFATADQRLTACVGRSKWSPLLKRLPGRSSA